MQTCLNKYVLALMLLAHAGIACAEDSFVPGALQFTLFSKALTFDRNLETRCGKELVIGILYQNRYRTSRDAMQEILNASSTSTFDKVKGLPLRVVSINIEDPSWSKQVESQSVNILYLMPVRAIDIHEITSLAQARKLLTLTADPAFVADGMSVGLRLVDSRPKFLINLGAARSEGVEFGSQLLGLAEVIE